MYACRARRNRSFVERIRKAGPPVASGLLLLLAFPPFNLVPLLFVALVPLLLSLRHASTNGAWKRGYVFGLVFGLGRLHFIEALTAQWTGSVALGVIPWLLAALAMAIYFGLVSMSIRSCWARQISWLIPLVWAGMEVLRSYLPVVAFPWALVAIPLWRYPIVIQEARLGTIYLIGAWVVLVNLALVFAIRGERQPAKWSSAVACGLLLASFVLYGLESSTTPVRVTVGQTGVDMAFGDPATQELRTAKVIDQLEKRALESKSRLLVLPEGSVRLPRLGAALPFLVDPRLPVLFGAQTGTGPIYQSAVAYDGRWQSVDKTRLVIFGEFVPGRDSLPFLAAFHLPSGDLSAGEHGTQALSVGGLRVGPVVCFEETFPDLAWRQSLNGAQMLAVISIDDWFMGSSAPEEFMAATVWRAVETGLPLVRSASLGYSFATDGHGRIMAQAPLARPEALEVDLPVPTHPVVGYWEPVFPLIAVASLFSVPWIKRKRSSGRLLATDVE